MLSLRRQAMLRQVEPAPPDWAKAFGRTVPLEVDLGCGRGDYAWQRAAGCPAVGVVALDMRRKWISNLRRAAQREGLALGVLGHALEALAVGGGQQAPATVQAASDPHAERGGGGRTADQ